MEVYRELSIRVKTNCGFSTLPDLPGIYTNPYERQKHPYQRRFLSFLFSHFMFLCKLQLLLSEHRTPYLQSCSCEWICSLKELQIHFRQKFQHQVISILDTLVEQNLLTYSLHEKNKIIQYKIKDWPKDNTALSYNYPCKKDIGFFFFPIADVHKLIGLGKCSEMDALLDLWIHAVYNDPSVQGSDAGPVVYFRNQTGNPLFSYQELARRWKQSKSSVSRLLKNLKIPT